MEITNPDRSFDISKKESESENNLIIIFFPNSQEHQQAAKPWKGPSVFHSQGLSSC